MQKLYRFSRYPIVGEWIVLRDEEKQAAMAAITDEEKLRLETIGHAKVIYKINNITWYATVATDLMFEIMRQNEERRYRVVKGESDD